MNVENINLDNEKNAKLYESKLRADIKEAIGLLDHAFGFLKMLYGEDTAYLDRYEALKAQYTAPTKNTDGGGNERKLDDAGERKRNAENSVQSAAG